MPKTYWHLSSEQRMPTEYELLGSQLAYHPRLGSALRTPTLAFCQRHACQWQVPDWEAFHDPLATTYTQYVAARRDREVFADQLLAHCDDGSYDAALPSAWLSVLDALLSPLRYPCHGLQLAAAYVAQAAPSGRLCVMFSFQAADELRRISRLAYRTKQLMLAHPGFAHDAKQRWLGDPALQPLREVIEHLLTSYAFEDAVCALNLVVKPLFDALFGAQLARVALAQGDDVLGRLLLSLHEDQRWHADVACGFARFVAEHGHGSDLRRRLDHWHPRVRKALLATAERWRPVCELERLRDALDSAYQDVLDRVELARLGDAAHVVTSGGAHESS